MLANFVVGTIGHVLFAALMAKHVARRHLALASKVVIADEAHAADHFIRHDLLRVLEWLGAYGVPVIVLSATLSAAQRIAVTESYERGMGRSSVSGAELAGNVGYPGISRWLAAPPPVQR